MGLPQYDPRNDFSEGDNVVDGQLVMDALSDEELFNFYRHCAATDDAIFQEALTSQRRPLEEPVSDWNDDQEELEVFNSAL